jgi:hypothetical protein
MARGHVYLAVVMDWASRRVLSWRVSITNGSGILDGDDGARSPNNFYCAPRPGSPWTFVTGGGFHLPVRASDFGP